MKKNFCLWNIMFLIFCGNTNSQIIENIEAPKFIKIINEKDGIIIDVRTTKEFNSGHIIGATNIDFYADDFTEKLKIVRKDVPIYLYCRSGARSSSSAIKMKKIGFTKIYNLVGGIVAWNSADYKTITSETTKKLNHHSFSISEIDSILEGNKIVLIDFSTEWCVPCKRMKPLIEEIKQENLNIKVLFVDADENKELIANYKINGVPVFIIYNSGKEIFRHVGEISKEELLAHLR